jgi:predicted CopG family antitoxin
MNYFDTGMNTTIAISPQLRDELKEFGKKGEKYEEIILRLLKSAKERQLHDFLMNTEGSIPIDEAITRAKKRWQK